MTVVFYISGHGFGHASRSIEIINALVAARPDARVVVRSQVPPWLFALSARSGVQLEPVQCDTGVVQIGYSLSERLVLLSFGGFGLRVTPHVLSALRGYRIVDTETLDIDAFYAAGFRYEDLVRTVDVVVSKPGYGIISECLANHTALLYTSRGHFAEYNVLVAAIPRFLRCAFIGHDDLFAGRWQHHLDSLVAQPAPPESPATDGADVAAACLLDMV